MATPLPSPYVPNIQVSGEDHRSGQPFNPERSRLRLRPQRPRAHRPDQTDPPFISYAQNFEDVLLWRALGYVGGGVYVDIGAQDPILDSVSKGFYEQGWRGVHIEPTAHYAELLRRDRPDETVIQAAVSDRPGMLRFFEIPGTGMSTGLAEQADTHRRAGWQVMETLVPAITLDELFSHIDSDEIHWLKIDVEGLEYSVLEGWRESAYRPWLVVVEATEPLTRTESYGAWEHLLLAKGYSFAYFDGLNRYYLAAAHGDLEKHFRYGPCLWDEFQLPKTSRHTSLLVQRHDEVFNRIRTEAEAGAAQVRADLAGLNKALGGTRGELRQALDELDRANADRRRLVEEWSMQRAHLVGELAGLNKALIETRSELKQALDELDRANADRRRLVEEWSMHRAYLVGELEKVTGSFWRRLTVPFRRPPALLSVLPAEMCTDGVCSPIARSLGDLVAHDGEAFVRCAYVTLLGREVDPEGLRHFLGCLARGSSREAIAAELGASPEGTKYGARLPGLDDLVRRHRLLSRPVVGRLLRALGVTIKSRRAFSFFGVPPVTGAGTGRVASSIEELLSLHDETFVRCAYATLLGRDPDPDGLHHHLALVRNGESRRAVVAAICLSEEGRQRKSTLPGLERAIRCYRWQRLPFVGPILRLVGGCNERFDVRRELAVIESQLDLLAHLAPASVALTQANDRPGHASSQAILRSAAAGEAARAAAGAFANSHDPVTWPSSLSWQIVGRTDESKELSLIRAEMARAFAELGYDVASGSPGVAADVTGVVALPPLQPNMGDGATMLVGHDWEESGYPEEWIDGFNATLCGVGCASSHALKILIDHAVGVPVAAVGLGVDHWERILAKPDYRGPGKGFRFLHVSSCGRSDGIDLLFDSFGRLFGADDDVSLIVHTAGVSRPDLLALLDRLRTVDPRFPDVIVIEEDLSDAGLKALYRQCHVFVAPSRATGFNLPIAQALLSGLPAVAVAWGGHRDYCDEANSWLVDYRFEACRTAYELSTSAWVEPLAASLDEALWSAYRATSAERFAKSWSGRKQLMRRFTWKDVALRLAALAEHGKAETAVEPSKPRVGWITTWNVKCGIAGHVAHLLASIPADEVVVFAARQEPQVRPDEPNCVRSWDPGKWANGLDEVARELGPRSVNALVIQFNYGFFNHPELRDFIEAAIARGIVVLIDFHSTIDPDGAQENFRLADLLPALRKCHRLLAHGPADMNRLKALGLTDNVTLFPLGVVNKGHTPAVSATLNASKLITSFGFCLPNKGLLELVEAVALLKREKHPVRLRMLNAEYPDPTSAAMVESLEDAITRLGLREEVELRTEFLDDELCLTLLGEAHLVVNPYQQSREAASAAARYGLAVGRPVLVTPLPIFDDLGDAVFRMPGTTPCAIAEGIASAIRHLEEGSETARRVRSAAQRWLEAHDCSKQGIRLMRIARTLARQEASIMTARGDTP